MPAIHISALPTRQNSQMELPSFSIPLQYNLGTFKKIEEVQFDIETPENEQWDGRMMPNFNLMNLKPLIENRENIDLSELKYEVKNENNKRVFSDMPIQGTSIEADDILGKETANDGQTISADFEMARYDNYQNDNEKRYRGGNFEGTSMDDGRSDFICDSDFLCKTSYQKVDEKRSEFEECHLLDADSSVGMSNFDANL